MAPRLCLPQEIRRDFARPRGLIYSGDITPRLTGASKLICVGDVVSAFCARAGSENITLVVDGKTRRSEATPIIHLESYKIIRVSNPPGGLTSEAINKMHECASSGGKCLIIVNGEEDMLALPAIASAPLNSLVVYGVPGVGAAIIRVTGYTRVEAANRLLELKPCPQGFKPLAHGGPSGGGQ